MKLEAMPREQHDNGEIAAENIPKVTDGEAGLLERLTVETDTNICAGWTINPFKPW